MKKWLKIRIISTAVLVDSISDFLMGVIGAGVEIAVDEKSSQTTMNGFVEKEDLKHDEIEEIIDQLVKYLDDVAQIFEVETAQLSWSVIEEEDWGKTWKKHFTPFSIIPGLVIAPTWEEYSGKTDEHVIVMDPGMAFGTGHHATTSLALQLLTEELQRSKGARVLDIGTGTGILGMAAALAGATRVLGIDNDEDAVSAAHENVKRNNLDGVMEVDGTPLTQLQEGYSLIVANIIHDTLVEMAAELQRLTLSGGRLIVSGILHGTQAENISAIFEDYGFVQEKQAQQDEWAALQFVKN